MRLGHCLAAFCVTPTVCFGNWYSLVFRVCPPSVHPSSHPFIRPGIQFRGKFVSFCASSCGSGRRSWHLFARISGPIALFYFWQQACVLFPGSAGYGILFLAFNDSLTLALSGKITKVVQELLWPALACGMWHVDVGLLGFRAPASHRQMWVKRELAPKIGSWHNGGLSSSCYFLFSI